MKTPRQDNVSTMTGTKKRAARLLVPTILAMLIGGGIAADDAVNSDNYIKLKAARLMDRGECVPYWFTQAIGLEQVAVDVAETLEAHTAYTSGTMSAEEYNQSMVALDEAAAEMASSLECEGAAAELIGFGRSIGWIRVMRDILIAKHMHVSPTDVGIDFELVDSDINGLITLENKIRGEYGANFGSVQALAIQEASARLQFMLNQDSASSTGSEPLEANGDMAEDFRRIKTLISDLVEHAAAEGVLADNGYILRLEADRSDASLTIVPLSDQTLEFPMLSYRPTLILEGPNGPMRAVAFARDDQAHMIVFGSNRSHLRNSDIRLAVSDGSVNVFEGRSVDCESPGPTCLVFDAAARDALGTASPESRFYLGTDAAAQ